MALADFWNAPAPLVGALPNHQGKKDGMARADANAPAEWKTEAYAAVLRCCQDHAEFTTDEVWAILDGKGIDRPHNPMAMGPIMLKAAKAGHIRKTGRIRASVQTTNHAREVTIWAAIAPKG